MDSLSWDWWAVQGSFLVVSTQLHALIPKDLLCTDCKFAINFGEISTDLPPRPEVAICVHQPSRHVRDSHLLAAQG